jgi:hypothetical protein
MPKTEIDYSNTIIYKITCKNQAIKDVYVGHTTNFVQRKHSHKQNCINSKSANHKCKLYEVIRTNGGWENWQMEIINFFNCADHYAARKKEHEYFIELKANLNSIEPLPKPKIIYKKDNIITHVKPNLYCNACNIKCDSLYALNIHEKTKKHITYVKTKSATENTQQSSSIYDCEICDYKSSRHSQYTRHLETDKHLKRLISTENNILDPESSHNFKCDKCSKIYKERSGLWRHKKTCTFVKPVEEKNPMEMAFLTNLVMEVVKNNSDLQRQNQELQKKMLDVCSKGGTNNSHNNSYNKTFNMQFFLNEQCKDAMNIMDFVNSMTLEFSDLEDVGKLGYVEGISNIIIRKLNALDIHKRPIHCSDAKREIMYVKDENIWEKENSTYDKLRKAIKHITCKNSAMLEPWSRAHPQCMNNQHRLNDVYVQMMGQAMGGKESFLESENKIMKKIAKAVLIEK